MELKEQMITILSVGFPLPFILLGLCLVGSYVCASIIANEENVHEKYSLNSPVVSKPNSMQANIKISKVQNLIPAFIHSSTKNTMHSLNPFQKSQRNNKNISNQMTILKEPPKISNHYACPPTSLEALRRRYGTNKEFWGDWSAEQTRSFYKQMLPKALQIDGALGLSLEQRAEIASANRHALRLYSRERCHLPARIVARLYDGLRHLHCFGYWKSQGMDWNEVCLSKVLLYFMKFN